MHRDPADIVVAFLNTLDVEEHTDVLDDPTQWRDWIRTTLAHGPDMSTDRESTRALRTHLRGLASGEQPSRTHRIPVSVAFEASGVHLASDTVIGTIAAAVAQLTIEHRWDRIKICPADDCRWAFYDGSRNHSRQWCSMQVCGNRAKVRKYRDR